MKTYRAKVSATVELIALVQESENGEIEIIDVEEVPEISEFENVRPLD